MLYLAIDQHRKQLTMNGMVHDEAPLLVIFRITYTRRPLYAVVDAAILIE